MQVRQQLWHAKVSAGVSIAVLCLTAVSLAACGGSASSKQSTTATHQSRPTPAHSNPDVGSAQAQVSPAEGTTATDGAATKSHNASRRTSASAGASGTGAPHKSSSSRSASTSGPAASTIKAQPVQRGRTNQGNDENTQPPPALNPCRLVSVSEAQTIVAGQIVNR